jgi:hypothetical protein
MTDVFSKGEVILNYLRTNEAETHAAVMSEIVDELKLVTPLADVGAAMVNMTTTVCHQDEWGAIPELWKMCMEDRDSYKDKLKIANAKLDSLQADIEKYKFNALLAAGYAPGGYSCTCGACGKHHDFSDKRSHVCPECAEANMKPVPKLSPIFPVIKG